MKKLAVLVAALAAFVTQAFAISPDAKSYKINLSFEARLGSNQLAPGDYMLTVDPAAVRLVEVRTGKSFDVAARIAAAERKFGTTAITADKSEGVAQIREICLGGTKIQIDFR